MDSIEPTADTLPSRTINKWAIATVVVVIILLAFAAITLNFLTQEKPNTVKNSNLKQSSTGATQSTPGASITDSVNHGPSPSPTPNSTSTSWPSYTDPTLRISFKYPPEWTVEKRTIHHPFNAQDTTDYHVISLKADQEIVTFTYPFELSGCGQSGQKVYTFGSHAVTMVDTCASTPKLAGTYYGWFKNPQPVPANVNAQDWPELVVAYRYSPQTEPDFIEFAKSVTGLTPR